MSDFARNYSLSNQNILNAKPKGEVRRKQKEILASLVTKPLKGGNEVFLTSRSNN